MKIYKKLIEELKNSKDVIIKEDYNNMVFFYQEQLCNIVEFNKDFYIRLNKNEDPDISLMGICKEVDENFDKLIQLIFMGILIIYNKNNNKFYSVDISKSPSRDTGDSLSEPEVIFGSRDGFVENYKENIALLRTRIKCGNLNISERMVGRRSKTLVSVLSISDIHNKEMEDEILKKIDSLDIDSVLEMSDISAVFQERRKLPAYIYLGSPDLAARHLLDGQFLIVIDRIPSVICLPITISSYTKTKIDSMNISIFTFFERIFVLFSLFFSTIFLGIVSSFMTFQKNSLSIIIQEVVSSTQRDTILPVFLQIIFVLLLFDLYSIIGSRSPKAVLSSTVVMIGGLIIGQNMIDSKIVGILIMTLAALSYLTGYMVTNNINFIMFIAIARLLFVISSIFFGIYGLTLGIIIFLSVLYKEKTLGIFFMHPFIPLDFSDFHSFFKPYTNLRNKIRPNFNVKDRTMKK